MGFSLKNLDGSIWVFYCLEKIVILFLFVVYFVLMSFCLEWFGFVWSCFDEVCVILLFGFCCVVVVVVFFCVLLCCY